MSNTPDNPKLYYDLNYRDWNEQFDVEEFTDENREEALHWFQKKLSKFGDFDEESVFCDRAVLLKSGTKLFEGHRFAMEDKTVFTVLEIVDIHNIIIGINI